MDKKIIIAVSAIIALGGASVVVAASSNVSNSVKGRILLQVEDKGQAWYVDPSGSRQSLGSPSESFEVMRNAGIGITNASLNKIMVADANLLSGTDTDGDGLSDAMETALGTSLTLADTDGDGLGDKEEILKGLNPNNSVQGSSMVDDAFSKKQAGKIFLQVESKGEAWYINPLDNKRYFLGNAADAFSLMRQLGLGISNSNLEKIEKKSNDTASSNNKSTTVTASSTKASTVKNNTDKPSGEGAKQGTSTPKFDIGKQGTSTPPRMEMATSTKNILLSACQNLASGNECSFVVDNNTATGTCLLMDEDLLCLSHREERREGAPGTGTSTPPLKN